MNFAGLRPIGSAVLLVLFAGAGCNRPKQASLESSTPPTPRAAAREHHYARARCILRSVGGLGAPTWCVTAEQAAQGRDTASRRTRGWRILYATTVDDSTPATAVATVFASTDAPTGPRPVMAWEHATTGLLQKCMPSLLSTPTKGIPWRNQIVMAGWVVVASDYSFAEKGGPHPYLIGEGEARATLDSVRAARQMSELTLDKRMVVWGYSQGGHAALWTGIVGPRYAPDLEMRRSRGHRTGREH